MMKTNLKVTNMTGFTRADFTYDGMYLKYQGRFVARFKGNTKNKPGFMSFLIKNFSVGEYFAAYDAGTPPAAILETKGYVSKTVQDILKRMGYQPTIEGYRAYIDDRLAKYYKSSK
jgi:hypothetical protein